MPMDRMTASGCALVLVDYQARLLPAIHGADAVVANAVRLADAARLLGITVHGTEQNPAGLGVNVDSVRQRCASTLAKMYFDGCDDGLLALLGESPQVVLAGCEAHVCLLQTGLGLRRAGRAVWVVADACGSRSPTDHALAMQRLHDAGAVVVSTEMVLFEWLQHCGHPAFRQVLTWVKSR